MRIGIDTVAVARLERALERSARLAARVFSPLELALCAGMPPRRRAEFLAGRFAAKEAVLKALGVGLGGGVELGDVETLRLPTHAPQLILHGTALAAASAGGATEFLVSITHESGMASAVAVLR